jgi:hypothetical protein
MPYCELNSFGEENKGGRLFYRRYGHGKTKVLLIIGKLNTSLVSLLFILFNFEEKREKQSTLMCRIWGNTGVVGPTDKGIDRWDRAQR